MTASSHCPRSLAWIGALLLALGAAGIPASAAAAALSARVGFAPDAFSIRTGAGGAYVSGARTAGPREVGEPVLPVVERLFYVPDGYEVSSVRVTPVAEETIARGVRLAQTDPDVSGAAARSLGMPVGAIVDGAAYRPTRSGQSLGGGNMGGFRVHSVALYPVRWEAATGDLRVATSLDVELDLVPRAAAADEVVRERPSPRADAIFRKALRALAVNADDVPAEPVLRAPATGNGGFAPEELPTIDGSAVDMVIITTDALAADFAPLADWKTKKGVPTVVRTVEWITANYPLGRDRAERMRDFIRDAYSKWGTYLVLLAGEHDTVTPLYAWTQYAGGEEIVTDQYFACLDGDWNADGDDKIGEGVFLTNNGDSADLYPEVFVGRASVESSTEAATFVGKSLVYDKTPPGGGWAESHGGLGEVIFPDSWEFGIDPPESIKTDGKKILRDSLDTYIPSTWARSLRYQSDNDEDRSIGLAELAYGHHLLSVVGHGDAFEFSVGNGATPLIFNSDIAALTNGDRLTFFVGVSCNPNQIDLECLGETMMNNPNGGMIAVLASTRSDFPIGAAAQTGSMLSMAFRSGLNGFGEMSQLGRVRYAGVSGTDLTVDRWTWLTKLLLGDPELRIWTRDPQGMVVTHAASVPLGTSFLAVTVQDSLSAAVPGALVCLSDGNGTYSRGVTDGSGAVTLPITSKQTGTLDVVATAPDRRPHESTVILGAAAGAHLARTSETIDDDGTGASSGNGDGVVDAGETIELGVTVLNGGVSTANGAAVQGTVEPGGSATFDLLYSGVHNTTKVFIGPNRVSPGAIPFTLDFASPSIEYIGRPSFTFAPDSTSGQNNADTGIFVWQDHDGWHVVWGSGKDAITVSGTVTTDGRVRGVSGLSLEAGEAASISAGQDSLTFSGTTGPRDAQDGVDFALSDSTMIALTTASAGLGDLAASAQATGTLVFDVAPTARSGQVAYVDLALTSTSGGPWAGEVPLVFAGPELEAYMFSVADSGAGLSGDGDGVAELGETVRLTPTVFNRGTGSAVAVTGSAAAAGGITFTDASDSYGEIVSLGESAGTDGYVFTLDDSTGTTIDLTLTDSLGRSWMKTMDFVPPVTPDSLWFESTESTISVIWTPSDSVASPDLAGYNIYRSATPGSGHAKHNAELLRTGSLFSDEGLALGSMYYYYVTAVDSSGNESAPTAEITAWTTQVQVDGWPQVTSGFNYPGILMTDADKDRSQEVYTGSHDADFYSWDHTGSLRPGFPLATAFQIWGPASAADMDQDGDEEIFFGSRDSRIYAVHDDASPLYGSTTYFKDLPGGSEDVRSAVTLADIDNDGRLEMLVGSDLGNVYAFNHDATGVIDSTGLFFTAPPVGLGSRVWGPFAVADLDHDGSKEIAFGSWNDSLYVVNAAGVRRPGFPKGGGDDFRAGAVFGDIDNDGTMEIVAGNYDGNLYAWNADGSDYVPGGILKSLPDGIPGGIALANLDADPELEIVFGCFDGNLYAINHDGSSFLSGTGGVFASLPLGPAANDGINASPIVVDVDGDGDFEIFVGHRNFNFYGFHSDGSLLVGMPIPTGNSIYATAAAGDLDDDGDVDIAFSSYDGSVNVLDFSGASTAAAYEWPTYAGNNARTATYGDRGPAVDAPSVPGGPRLVLALDGAAPNPFSFGTTVRYVVPTDRRITLSVFNVSGRLVRRLVDGPVAAGRNAVVWDGRDGRGRPLSSGVYFFRLQDDARALTRKAVLLR